MSDSFISSPVTVPANFVGCCTRAIATTPVDVTSGITRSWDFLSTTGNVSDDCVVTYINPSSGVYSWTSFDQLFSRNSKRIIFTLGSSPDYLVSRAAVGGSYRGTKGNMCPDDLNGYVSVVQTLVSRAQALGRTGVIWELWNEIDQNASYHDTVSLLGPYTKAVSQAIKAIDPTAIVLSPSIAGYSNFANMKTYFSCSDGAGGTAGQWVDGISLHYYNQLSSQISPIEHPYNYIQALTMVQNRVAALGYNLPVYITESGVIAADTNGWRAYQRRILTFAALGAKCCLCYSYDDSSYPIAAYKTQYNDVANKLAGAVISSFVPGIARMKITIDGVEYTY